MTNKYRVEIKGNEWGNRGYIVYAETEQEAEEKAYGLELEKRIPVEKIEILSVKRVDK